ncbi:MAG: hypothetical protein ACW97P_10275 [Candidatus Hodarchaeales archaeon]|jgi:regulator of PEP synthase PpsR (kinase-PPPase family)
MKITKQQLKQIIKEELQNIMTEMDSYDKALVIAKELNMDQDITSREGAKMAIRNAAGGDEELEAKILDHLDSMDSPVYALAMME